jgi:NosR/NirI family transcriptional regulator, nitrous oxide reductase regulator
MRRLAAALPALLVALVLPASAARAQDVPEALREPLSAVLPAADSFAGREGEPPVFRAYRTGSAPGGASLVGYAFLTGDLPPEQMGFDGPIEVLVGMDLEGRLTGVRVLDYRESLRRSRGDFLSAPGFQRQFAGKSVADAFQVKRDVEGITGATISVDAMSRGVRSAARRVAVAYGLNGGSTAPAGPALDPLLVTAVELERLSWSGVTEAGLVSRIQVIEEGRVQAELALMPLRNEAVAEVVLGGGLLAEVRQRTGVPLSERRLVVAGLDGPLAGGLNLARLSVVQDGDTAAVQGDGVLLFGAATEGKLDGQVRFVRVLLLAGALDLARPFTFVLDLRPGLGVYAADWPAAVTAPLAAAVGAPAAAPAPEPVDEQIARALLAFQDESEETGLARTLATTSWPRLGGLALLLALATAAFVTKAPGLRWAALLGTLAFLGFADRSFLSISHLSGGLRVGPDLYLSDLRLLLLVAFTVVTTLLVGRVFCGYLCPFGALQDLLDWFVPRRWKREMAARTHERAKWIKYGVLALVLAPALLGSGVSLFQYFEPFGTVFFLSPSLLLWSIALGLLAGCAVVPRFYCRYVCPLGAALALGSLLAPFRIRRVEQCTVCKVCEQRCPTRAIRAERIAFEECVRCNVCEIALIRKAGVCRHDMEVVRSRLVRLEVGRG